MKERDILHENGAFWVLKAGGAFHVMRQGITHSTTESAYADLSLAKARCDYLAKFEGGTKQ